jgi:DNA-binding transcriptional LysR family regulator
MLNASRMLLLAKVDELGSITAAALALSYSPSAVSQQLRKLEREAGQPLFDRRPDGAVVNEAGRMLVAHARLVETQLLAAQADLDEIGGLRRGRLAIGTFRTIGSSFLPHAIRRFKTQFPGVDLVIESGRLEDLLRLLVAGTVDMALLWDYDWNPLDDDRLVLTELFVDPTVLLVSADHPLARRRKVDLAELADELWIAREDNTLVAEVLERSCRAAGFTPKLAVRAHDYQEMQALVSVGLGIAILPLTAIANRRPDIRAISLGASAPSRKILLGERRVRVRPPAEGAMATVMHDAAADYLAAVAHDSRRA